MSRYGIVFMGFLMLVFFYWGITALGAVFTSGVHFGGIGPSFDFGIGSGSSGGLAEVDFALFSSKIQKNYITQGYGRTAYSYLYVGRRHNGVDIAAQYGAPVLAATGGTVAATGNQDNYCYGRAYGKFVAVRDTVHGVVLLYAHLGAFSVKTGESITQAQKLGTIGATGLETGPHLHLTVFQGSTFDMSPKNGCGPYPQGTDTDPVKFLDSLKTIAG